VLALLGFTYIMDYLCRKNWTVDSVVTLLVHISASWL